MWLIDVSPSWLLLWVDGVQYSLVALGHIVEEFGRQGLCALFLVQASRTGSEFSWMFRVVRVVGQSFQGVQLLRYVYTISVCR